MATRTLAWGARVSAPFRTRLYLMCEHFRWSDDLASDAMSCMAWESARTFSPSIRNGAGSGATGLIQFMRPTAEGLGTTTDKLALMTAEKQLDYVEMYFQPYAKRIKTLPDMYMAILLPKYIGQPDDAVLFSEGIAYRQNAGLDANSDGKITKREAAARVIEMRQLGMMPGNVFGTPDFSNVLSGVESTAPQPR